MPTFHDKTGLRFGRLVALEPCGRRSRNLLWFCRCDCANTTVVFGYNLVTGRTKSCGCLHRELSSARARAQTHPTTHGQTRTATYSCWEGMIQRCCNPKAKSYKRYGGAGRGIEDERWFSFQNFFDDMGDKPPGTELHRIKNDRGYSKANCVWLARAEHMRLHATSRSRLGVPLG